MRRNADAVVLPVFTLLAAVLVAGCPSEPVDDTKVVDLKIASISPGSVYFEGLDRVTIKTENGCGAKAELKVADLTTAVTATDDDTILFTPPPKPVGARTTYPVVLDCPAPAKAKTKYGVDHAESSIVYDPALEPLAIIKTNSPTSTEASVLSRMVVVFSRAVDPASVTKESFGISGVSGHIEPASDNQTFTFIPDQQLQYSTQYSCFVTDAVRKFKPTLSTGKPGRDEWSFTTRCEGCGNPWLGDISAAAGISSGGQYKLFSVTGQPTPVGEASNDQYKIQSGFIYATTPVP